MRIVGGKYRGKILSAPEGQTTRPTTDRARESLFNILAHRYPAHDFNLVGSRVLDLCAGTGALGLEALSRGASHVTFVERCSEVFRTLKRNVQSFKLPSQTELMRVDACHLQRAPIPCSLVFLDPPYTHEIEKTVLDSAVNAGWLCFGAVIVVETDSKVYPQWPDGFIEDDRRAYGKSSFTLLRYMI